VRINAYGAILIEMARNGLEFGTNICLSLEIF